MFIVDGYDIEVPESVRKAWNEPYQDEANDTFMEVVRQVRGVVDDEDISSAAWRADLSSDWPVGLYDLLVECDTAGAVVSEELLDRCMKSDCHGGIMAQVVEPLRARARGEDLSPA